MPRPNTCVRGYEVMNILMLATSYFPHIGGVEQVVRKTSIELMQFNHEVVIVTERKPRSLAFHQMIDNCPVYRLPFTTYGLSLQGSLMYPCVWLYTVGTLFRLVRRHNIDILHLQGVSRNGPYGVALKRRTRLPMVATVHGVEVEGIGDQRYPRAIRRWQTACLRQVACWADMWTACSHYLGEVLLQVVPEIRANLRPIHNGIHLEEFADLVLSDTGSASRYILSTGRLVPKKGFDTLLHAFAHMLRHTSAAAKVDLVIAGDGPERQRLEALAHTLEISQRVHWLGMITDRQRLSSLYQACEFLVVPSRHEPFGIVCLEGLAARKPVVATRVGGIPEIIRDEQDGLLVPSDDPAQMAEAMERIIVGNHQLYGPNQLCERAAHFAWPEIVQQYLDVYQQARDSAQ